MEGLLEALVQALVELAIEIYGAIAQALFESGLDYITDKINLPVNFLFSEEITKLNLFE